MKSKYEDCWWFIVELSPPAKWGGPRNVVLRRTNSSSSHRVLIILLSWALQEVKLNLRSLRSYWVSSFYFFSISNAFSITWYPLSLSCSSFTSAELASLSSTISFFTLISSPSAFSRFCFSPLSYRVTCFSLFNSSNFSFRSDSSVAFENI